MNNEVAMSVWLKLTCNHVFIIIITNFFIIGIADKQGYIITRVSDLQYLSGNTVYKVT